MKDKKIINKSKKYKKTINKPKITKKDYISKHSKKTKKIKIKYGRLFLFLVVLFLLLYLVFNFVKFPITNIFIYNNNILSDQEIIDLAGISDYPSVLSFTTNEIENKLEKNIYIKKAKVVKKFRQIHITVEDNYGLFYNNSKKVTVLKNKKEVKKLINTPILVNYVIDDVYKLFIEKMMLIDKDILNRISEIKYDPNTVDSERFIFTMSDGNYVYITLEKIESINSYVDIIKTFENKKGILYLDSGEYFKVFEN